MAAALDEALHRACDRRHLDPAGARFIHHYSNAVYLLPAEKAVARIASDSENPARIRVSQTITNWLSQDLHFPATAPLPGVELVQVDPATTVTFWTYYPQPAPGTAEPLTSAHLGQLLHALHQIEQAPIDLQRWIPLESLERTLSTSAAAEAISSEDRGWLIGCVQDVRDELATLDWPLGEGLIHGDAWAGNLLWDTSRLPARAVLADWDRVSHGPREVDLIPTWHATVRYGRDESWIQSFISNYGHDLRDWVGYQTLLTMRDLAQLPGPLRRSRNPPHAAALKQRITAIRDGDRTSTWTAL